MADSMISQSRHLTELIQYLQLYFMPAARLKVLKE